MGDYAARRLLYKTRQWKYLRKARLDAEPICRFCALRGKVVAAEVVDHIVPHKGDEELFFSYENTQSLCATCHNSAKQSEEIVGYTKEVNADDGWPVDPRHPVNR